MIYLTNPDGSPSKRGILILFAFSFFISLLLDFLDQYGKYHWLEMFVTWKHLGSLLYRGLLITVLTMIVHLRRVERRVEKLRKKEQQRIDKALEKNVIILKDFKK